MSEWDEVGVVFTGPGAAELRVPPTRYPFPASTQPPLEEMSMVTIGVPGQWWLVDQLYVAGGPYVAEDGREHYDLSPGSEWGAAVMRSEEQAHVTSGGVAVKARSVATERIWVYRDGPQEKTVSDLEPVDSLSWYSRVSDASTPPPARHPRPARELPSLPGALLRMVDGSGGWMWVRAMGDPIDDDGDIVVPVCLPLSFWRAIYLESSRDPRITRVALHRLWTY